MHWRERKDKLQTTKLRLQQNSEQQNSDEIQNDDS